MEEQQEILEVFDRHNRRIGQATRGTIHRLGLRHRSVHIFVFDCASRLYLQLRREYKDQYPRHWDTSAAGHVSPGESYGTAAARELAEELGIQETLEVVAEVAACPQTGWEHVVLFQCRTAKEPTPNPAEIATGAFYTLKEIERMLRNSSLPITPAFRLLYRLWRNEGWKQCLK
jgi:isopentenyl-diphosphate Delta-isomerase